MGIPQMMMQGVSRNILPALSEQSGKRDLAGFKRLYLRATIFTGLVISGLTLIGLPLSAGPAARAARRLSRGRFSSAA